MNSRALAISILQQARDALAERLTERVIDAKEDIAADADGSSYLSEIENIYDQLGGRLSHLNAMLSNLPPDSATTSAPDAAANEIIYADLASAYPAGLAAEGASNICLPALPLATEADELPAEELIADDLENIVVSVQLGDFDAARRLISEVFDIKPSQATRAAQAIERQLSTGGELMRHIAELSVALEESNEYAAATLLVECFEFLPIEALGIVRTLRLRMVNPEAAE